MTKYEYLDSLSQKKIDEKKVEKLKAIYHAALPNVICKIVSNNNVSIFFDNGIRIMSYSEMLDAEKDLHVDFSKKGIIPIADCGENDFVVYHFHTRKWSKYNIIDELSFSASNSIEDVL